MPIWGAGIISLRARSKCGIGSPKTSVLDALNAGTSVKEIIFMNIPQNGIRTCPAILVVESNLICQVSLTPDYRAFRAAACAFQSIYRYSFSKSSYLFLPGRLPSVPRPAAKGRWWIGSSTFIACHFACHDWCYSVIRSGPCTQVCHRCVSQMFRSQTIRSRPLSSKAEKTSILPWYTRKGCVFTHLKPVHYSLTFLSGFKAQIYYWNNLHVSWLKGHTNHELKGKRRPLALQNISLFFHGVFHWRYYYTCGNLFTKNIHLAALNCRLHYELYFSASVTASVTTVMTKDYKKNLMWPKLNRTV